MAAKESRGSIILEILIVLMALLLVAVILVPDRIWKEENKITTQCRDNLNALYEAEQFFYRGNDNYTDSLDLLLNYVHTDSGLIQRQQLVSLTRSMIQVFDNVLAIPAVEKISGISQGLYEISGDLMGNDRYFRRYEDLKARSEELLREIGRLDSSATVPNFSRLKVYIDSLKNIRDGITDYPLQNGILKAIAFVDTVINYLPRLELEQGVEQVNTILSDVDQFAKQIKKTDIVKVSSVADRLNKFSGRVRTNVNGLKTVSLDQNLQQLEVEKQHLTELHQKFLSPDYFMLSQRYALTRLGETDSILLNLSEKNFHCPDDGELYIIRSDSAEGVTHLTVECPNLLDLFSQKFREDVAPVQNLQLYGVVDRLDTVIAQTRQVLDENRKNLRRYTDILLDIKELMVEFDNIQSVLFYKYTKDLKNFVDLVQKEKQLSILKPAIEDILNPMDTLATRMDTGNIRDLEEKITYFQGKLTRLDSLIEATRMPRRLRKKVKLNAEVFQAAQDILGQIKSSFNPTDAQNLRDASQKLEKDLLHALEGIKERVHVIFYKKHINHGFIKDGEKSWEME